MSVSFAWNENFEQELRQEIGDNFQRSFDRLARTHRGKDDATIRRALRRELDLSGEIDQEWVDAIRQGTDIEVKLEWEE